MLVKYHFDNNGSQNCLIYQPLYGLLIQITNERVFALKSEKSYKHEIKTNSIRVSKILYYYYNKIVLNFIKFFRAGKT